MTSLSVVLISKNQAWNIRRLLESVLRETAQIPGCEIVLVDSASEDETVNLAREYPVGIVQLLAEQRLTAAAGRYIGYMRTNGKFVLFLDGDMELCAGWLSRALELIEQRPEMAVVTGLVVDIAPGNEVSLPQGTDTQEEVPFCGGAGMFRRSVLREVGSFNPYLYSDEEPELCLRIRAAGHRVVRTGYPIVKHFSPDENTVPTLMGRWRRNLYFGCGQVIRYYLGRKLLWSYLALRSFVVIPAVALLVGLTCFAVLVLGGDVRWFASWCLLVGLVIVVGAARKRSIAASIASIFRRMLMLIGTVEGLTFSPRAPETYPGKLRVIQEARTRTLVA